jgi:hypothetical protein
MGNDPKANPAGDGETIEVTAASGGQKTGHIRWVLGIGTVAAIAGMVAVWLVTHLGR